MSCCRLGEEGPGKRNEAAHGDKESEVYAAEGTEGRPRAKAQRPTALATRTRHHREWWLSFRSCSCLIDLNGSRKTVARFSARRLLHFYFDFQPTGCSSPSPTRSYAGPH